MRILVTGANGFIGSHLIKELILQGHEVTGLVRKSSVLNRLKGTPVKLLSGDITDMDFLMRAFASTAAANPTHPKNTIDCIFHIAAYVAVGQVDSAKMENVNVEGTRCLLEAAHSAQIKKIIYCSSISIYGDSKGEVIDETFGRTNEDLENNLESNYARTKYKAQKLVDQYAQQDLPIITLLPATVLGKDDPHFLPILKKYIRRRLFFIVGGQRITELVHIQDLVQAFILAAKYGKIANHYIISAGRVTIKELMTTVCKELKINDPIEIPKLIVKMIGYTLEGFCRIFPTRKPILNRERLNYLYKIRLQVSSQKARTDLNWQPRSTRRTILDIAQEIKI